MKIGFIGLGNVGAKLAGSLLRNKFNLTVVDLDTSLVKYFVSKGSATAKSPKELAEKVDLIITCLPSPKICAEVMEKKTFFIEVEKIKYEAILQSKPLHDPENKIIKS